jgi:hypothetical protein
VVPAAGALAPREARVAALLLVFVTVVAYAPVVHAGFVFDDVPLVVQNTLTGTPARWREAFSTDLWRTSGADSDSGYYRPILLLDLGLDRVLFGLSPAAHHLHSLAWHVLASGLLLALLRRLVAAVPALIGAAIFALHPVQTEAVVWVAARNDLMATSFLLAGLLALLPREAGAGRAVAGAGLLLLGLLSKETTVLAPLGLCVLDLARFGRPGRALRYAACAAAIAMWWGMRTAAGIAPASVPDLAGLIGLAEGIGGIAAAWAGLLLLGGPLSVGRFLPYLELTLPGALALVALAGLAAAALWRGRSLALAGLVFALGASVPSLLAIGVRGQVGERYLYVPLVGVALAVASALPDRRRLLGFTAPLALLAVASLQARLPAWRTDLSLWEAAHGSTPSPYTATALGRELVAAGRPVEATPIFHAALTHQRPYPPACLPAIETPLSNGDLAAAFRGARLVVEAHCPRGVKVAAAGGRAALLGGDVALARRLTTGLDDEPTPALLRVQAALALLDGDEAAYDRAAAALDFPDDLRAASAELAGLPAEPSTTPTP